MSGPGQDQKRRGRDQKWSDRIDIDGIGSFLRSIYPDKTAANVAADTGLPADSVKKWLNRESSPGFKAALVLMAVYGPEFVHSMFQKAPAWLSKAASEERLSKINAQIAALEAARAAVHSRS